jgi:hypothetical protein
MRAALIIVLYFIPVIVAYAMKVPRKANVWLVNVLLGWTVIGWFVALGLCFYLKRETPGTAPTLPPGPTGLSGPMPITPSEPPSAPSSLPWEQGSGSAMPAPPPADPGAMPWEDPGGS